MLISRRAVFLLLRKLCDGALKPSNRFVEVPQLRHERRRRLAHFKRDCLVAGLDQPSQFAGVSGPPRRDDADFGQAAAQAVQQRRLVLKRAHADKPHRRPSDRLANRRRVRCVVLLPPRIGLHISRGIMRASWPSLISSRAQ
jgi:hypothetical protein